MNARERLAEAHKLTDRLWLHQVWAFNGTQIGCSCDHQFRSQAQHREHLADALLPVVDALCAERAAEAVNGSLPPTIWVHHDDPAAVAARPAGGDKARPCPSPVCDYPDHGWRPSAPSSPVPDDVREGIARWLGAFRFRRRWSLIEQGDQEWLLREAEDFLTTPALRRALAERDEARAAVERVRTLADKLGVDPECSCRPCDALRGERYALEDVAREFGVDLDAEDGETP